MYRAQDDKQNKNKILDSQSIPDRSRISAPVTDTDTDFEIGTYIDIDNNNQAIDHIHEMIAAVVAHDDAGSAGRKRKGGGGSIGTIGSNCGRYVRAYCAYSCRHYITNQS